MKIFNSITTKSKQATKFVMGRGLGFVSGKRGLTSDTCQISTAPKKIKPPMSKILRRLSMPKFDAKEIAGLRKLEGSELLCEIRRIVGRNIGIPEDLAPSIIPVDKLGRGASAAYAPSENVIYFKQKLQKKPMQLLSLIAHEMQHCKQNYAILRSDELAPRAIEKYTEQYAKKMAMLGRENWQKKTEEEFTKTLAEGNEVIRYWGPIYRNGDIKIAEANIKQEQLQVLEQLRKLVVDKYGKLPEVEEPYAKACFDDFMKGRSVFNPEYWLSVSEIEAYGNMFLFHCKYMLEALKVKNK